MSRAPETNIIIPRTDWQNPPAWKLPVYPRSVGRTMFRMEEEEDSGPRPFVQLNWCVKGKGTMLAEEGRTVEVEAGSVLFTPPGERNLKCSLSPEWVIRWVTFDGADAWRFCEGYGYPRLLSAAGSCPEELFREFELLIREHTVVAMRQNLSLLCRILAAAGGSHCDGSREGRLIESFLRLARERFCDSAVNLNTLCDELNIHRATLTRVFTPRMKVSPGRHLQLLRIQHALHLLRSTALPIQEIAHQAGIRDSGYFAKVIRDATGCTPNAYRKQR